MGLLEFHLQKFLLACHGWNSSQCQMVTVFYV
jgi:hypothetical protein